jgi:CheY-like chemotaxis protein
VAAAAPAGAIAATAGAPPDGEQRTVLVVDDVAANRPVARAMLEAAGHRVELASDGAEAMAAVERRDYNAVLMDVQMPAMDGLEATRRIRALPGARGRVPSITLPASALPGQVAARRAAGMDGHLAKPIDRAALNTALSLMRRPAVAAAPAVPPPPTPPHAAPAADGQPLVEEATLAGLAGGLGPAAAHGILAEFVEEIRRALALVAEAAPAAGEGAEPRQEDDLLHQSIHRLIGAARTLGARRLSAAAERLQRAAAHGPAEEVRALHAQLCAIGAATLAALDTRPELSIGRNEAAAGAASRDTPPRPVPQSVWFPA